MPNDDSVLIEALKQCAEPHGKASGLFRWFYLPNLAHVRQSHSVIKRTASQSQAFYRLFSFSSIVGLS
jgi:hypothetical protein